MMVAFLGMLFSREASIEEDLPFFLIKDQTFLYVELAGDAAPSGVYQLSDGASLRDVIRLTGMSLPVDILDQKVCGEALRSGELLKVVGKVTEKASVQRSWMPASHRLTLGIKLHPDRMTLIDWRILPGIGPVLAKRIEENRQSNGDFEHLKAMERVRGIGPKRIKAWAEFF